MTKALGVLIPTYNRIDTLLECLAHLENQTFKDFEVVVVDDGSTDSTPQRMEDYLKGTSLTIQYVRQKNSGPAKARNLGISRLQAPVCLMLGDDIFASPTLVESHMRLHREFVGIEDAVLGLTKWSTSGQQLTPFMLWLGKSPVQFAYEDLLAGVQPDWKHFYTSNLSVKTELLKMFPFREDFPYAAMEDIELGYRLEIKCGLKIHFIPGALAFHLHPATFRQVCERMIRVGYSSRLFHEMWPEQRPLSSHLLKKTVKHVISRSPQLMKLLTFAADHSARILCPNPFMMCAIICHYELGYRSERDDEGRLIPQ